MYVSLYDCPFMVIKSPLSKDLSFCMIVCVCVGSLQMHVSNCLYDGLSSGNGHKWWDEQDKGKETGESHDLQVT